MSGEKISIDFDLIGQHATRVKTVAAGVRTAHSAATSMNMSGGAFGIMCSFLVGPATLVSSAASGTIAAAAALVERSGTQIQAVGKDFSALEAAIQKEIEPFTEAVEQVHL